MKTIFACTRSGRARVLAAFAGSAVLVGMASAGEPVPMGANELASLPATCDAGRLLDALSSKAASPSLSVTPLIGGRAVVPVDLGKLEHERGRADTVRNDTKLNGDVANNSAVNVQTGSNTIDAGSFANMSGIPVVIQNSGANVLIQNATVVNLQFQ